MSPTQAEELIDPMERSPLEFPFGMFIADADTNGGAQGFAWFEDEAEARDYLRNQIWCLYDPDGDESASESVGLRGAINKALNEAAFGTGIPCQLINEAQGDFDLRWAGDFHKLWVGSSDFEEEIQSDYRENVFGDERGFLDGECDDQAAHLLHYNG